MYVLVLRWLTLVSFQSMIITFLMWGLTLFCMHVRVFFLTLGIFNRLIVSNSLNNSVFKNMQQWLPKGVSAFCCSRLPTRLFWHSISEVRWDTIHLVLKESDPRLVFTYSIEFSFLFLILFSLCQSFCRHFIYCLFCID